MMNYTVRLKRFKWRALLVTSLAILAGCDNDDVVPEEKVLLTSDKFLTRNASELKTFLGAGQIDIDLDLLEYDVELYKITYKTSYLDQEITASGLVILPQTTDPVGMISFQHGTITSDEEAPTNLALSSTQSVLYAGLASPGFIGVVPDYIGFGSSSSLLHPYYVEELTASVVIDNLKAARELAIEKGLIFNEKLFLAGYSQGGYATMATHKSIEADGLPGFNLVASFPASGGYDVKAMQEYFFGLTEYEEPYYIAYVAQAYQTTFNWSEPLSDFFNEPYASRIPALFDGESTSSQINAQLTTSIADLINDDLLQNINTDSKFEYINEAFVENSLIDWVPSKPVYMYHGDADITVPFENSVVTFDKLISNGASEDVLKFYRIEGATHASGVIPYIENFVPIIISLK